MKWNGIVSHRSQRIIARTFATANESRASSTPLLRKAVADVSHGQNRRLGSELLADPSHAHVDDVRAWVEAVAPHVREQPLAADHLAGVLGEAEEQAELTLREVRGDVADLRLSAAEV